MVELEKEGDTYKMKSGGVIESFASAEDSAGNYLKVFLVSIVIALVHSSIAGWGFGFTTLVLLSIGWFILLTIILIPAGFIASKLTGVGKFGGKLNAEFRPEPFVKRVAESRVLDMIDSLNMADWYIFLFNYNALFYNGDRQELPDDLDDEVMEMVMRYVKQNYDISGSIESGLEDSLLGGYESGQAQADKSIAKKWADVVSGNGGLPRPSEVRDIIKQEYLPELMRTFGHDLACYYSVALITVSPTTLPYTEGMSKEECIKVVENPTKENLKRHFEKVKNTKSPE